ncbi:hypothetical protein [Mesorhizobium sp. Pch-S]|uniref:hypothetical protein n=1 Tax=Mesorhizobium sp. Pch-S TaxID=2082387 RepID=UPI00101147E2|nr:hypothetical protein [Mesorhizobium sp. Pch-S]QAZ46776.1 hypothetical protein C1M53_31475 [Mesorhizobium sp. Pch-S]
MNLQPGMMFVRKRNSCGLPKDYELKPHHKAGYRGIVWRVFPRGRIKDVSGHKHACVNIRLEEFG